MRSTQIESQVIDAEVLISDSVTAVIDSPIIAVLDASELAFELGVWLASLQSFVRSGGSAFAERPVEDTTAVQDRRREFRLTRTALLTCAKLNFRLRSELGQAASIEGLATRELDELLLVLRDAIILNENILASQNVGFAEWKTWSDTLQTKLASSAVPDQLTRYMRSSGEKFLPERLARLLNERLPFAVDGDLRIVLPRFGLALGALGVIGKMLAKDEPLKPSLLVFSFVHDHTQELIGYMGNLLQHLPPDSSVMFDSLDSASYTASLELKKVYSQELSGVTAIRPVPSVFAHIETAHELLCDSFRQILAGFARVLDPQVTPADLFQTFHVKLENSLALRKHLWSLLLEVNAVEKTPETAQLDTLKVNLRDFLETNVVSLFHKDKETLERFAEEVFATTEGHDVVPILHRFGAYVETLLGQVNMRTVLADNPFDPSQI